MGEQAARQPDVAPASAEPVRWANPLARPARRRRVFIEDARRNGCYLRATWHDERRVFVVSTWRDEVCTGAIRLPVEDSAELAGLLVDGMAQAVRLPAVAPSRSRRLPLTVSGARKVLDRRWRALRASLGRHHRN